MKPFESIYRASQEVVIALENHRDKATRLPKIPSIDTGNLDQRWFAIPGLAAAQRVLTDFNIFAALNATDYETRHSNFLAWLLNPVGSHGLGPAFLRTFLALVSAKAGARERKAIETGLAKKSGFSAAEIKTEFNGADLVVVDHDAGLVCLVENKIHSGEHSNQLARYRQMLATEFPKLVRVFVFLTLKDEAPSEPAYLPFSYAQLCQALRSKRPTVPAINLMEARALILRQYVDFIEGYGPKPMQPNVFNALRLREIKHSDFLAWLLEPRANHGLGSAPLQEFLRLVNERDPGLAIPFRVDDAWDDFEISRETYNIDVLIVSERHRFVCLVENKLEAREGNDQLQRYKAYVHRWYPGFKTALVFLTLRGDRPTDAEYVSMRFCDFTPWLHGWLSKQPVNRWIDATIVATLLEHYELLLKERLSLRLKTVTQLAPGMDDRCKEIWQREPILVPNVLAGIFGWQAKVKADVESFVLELIADNFGPCFRPDFYPGRFRDYLPFVPGAIDRIGPLRKAGQYDSTEDRLFDFLVLNRPFEDRNLTSEPAGVTIIATLRPTAPGFESLRNKIYELANADRALFNKADRDRIEAIGNCRVLIQTLIGEEDFVRYDLPYVKPRLRERFRRFATGPYCEILRVLKASVLQS